MKSAIAAYVAAHLAARARPRGTLSLLITGDEEGYATYGTPRIIDWLNERQIRPDMILIGEPTSVDRLGDTVKIGRRGSVNMWIEVPGVQGHVAYPHRATNPIPPLARVIAALDAVHLDDGTDAVPAVEPRVHRDLDPDQRQQRHPGLGDRAAQHPLQQSPARRRPGEAWSRRSPSAKRPARRSRARISGEAFLTPPGQLYDVVVEAIEEETGHKPELSTSGGTSDGRFLIQLCPVVDFGLPNATMHKVGECAAVEDIHALSRIYERIVRKVLGLGDRLARRGRRCRSRRGIRPRTSAGRRRSPGRCRSPSRAGCRPGRRSRPLRRRSRSRRP